MQPARDHLNRAISGRIWTVSVFCGEITLLLHDHCTPVEAIWVQLSPGGNCMDKALANAHTDFSAPTESDSTKPDESLSRYAWSNATTEKQPNLESLRKIIGHYKTDSDRSTLAVLGQKALDVTIDGISKIPEGFKQSLSLESMAKNVALGFGVGAAMKAILSATGSTGKATSAVLTAVFIGKPLAESYALALTSRNQAEMDVASTYLGNAIGGMPVAFAEGFAGAKLGSHFVGGVMKFRTGNSPAIEPVNKYTNAFFDGKRINLFHDGKPISMSDPVFRFRFGKTEPGMGSSQAMVQNRKIGPIIGIPDTTASQEK